jgi:ABC-type transport system involved in cytochrome c biogenesis ATPase subunit
MNKPSVHLENLDFYGNNKEIIFSIKDFITFQAGDIIYLEADNASGKTTLLQFISGLLNPDRVKKNDQATAKLYVNQEIEFDLLNLSAKSEKELRIKNVSFFLDKVGNAPKSYPFGKALTFPIDEHLRNKLNPEGEKQLDIQKDELVNTFKKWFLKNKEKTTKSKILKQNWTRLSAGQQQALFIMQTLLKASVSKTLITILDEPLNYFSYENRKNMSDLILNYIYYKLNPNGIVMLVSHQKDFETLYLNGINKKIDETEIKNDFTDLLMNKEFNMGEIDNFVSKLVRFLNKNKVNNDSRRVRIFSIKEKILIENMINS